MGRTELEIVQTCLRVHVLKSQNVEIDGVYVRTNRLQTFEKVDGTAKMFCDSAGHRTDFRLGRTESSPFIFGLWMIQRVADEVILAATEEAIEDVESNEEMLWTAVRPGTIDFVPSDLEIVASD